MPASDKYHKVVVSALQKDGWTVTHEHLHLTVVDRSLYIDIGAERLIGAERKGQYIAVEIKSFSSASSVDDLQNAIGQYSMYEDVLEELGIERTLYLAVPRAAYDNIFQERLGQIALRKRLHYVMVYDPQMQEVVEWLPAP